MIVVYACLVLAVLAVLIPGGEPRRLAEIELRWTSLIWGALLLQVAVISVLPAAGALSKAAHLATYAAAALFVVANRRLPGVPIVAVGGALNLVAIVANGGTMPADRGALEASGRRLAEGRFANSAPIEDPRLGFLGDVFATPSWFPAANVFSIGDVVIVAGVAFFLYRATRPRGARAPQAMSPDPAP